MKIEDILINRLTACDSYKLFDKNNTKEITGLKGGSEALFFATLLKEKNETIFIIKDTEDEAENLTHNIHLYTSNCFHFPDYDIVPFSEISPISDVLHERINILNKAILNEKMIIVASVKSILRLLPSIELFSENRLKLEIGMQIDLDNLRLFLSDLGYVGSVEVLEKGVVSVRGSIVDIFSPVYEHPMRIEFFDDEIESIRFFNIEDGRSFGSVNEATIVPVRECIFEDDAIEDIINSAETTDIIKEKLQNSKYFAGSENLLTLFDNNPVSIFKYLSKAIILLSDKNQLKNIFNEYIQAIEFSFDNKDNIFSFLKNYNSVYIEQKEFDEIINNSINICPFETFDTDINFDFKEGLSFKSKLAEFLEYLNNNIENNKFIVLTTSHQEQAERFYKLTEELNPKIIKDDEEIDSEENFFITVAKSSLGFISENMQTLFIADHEVFGRKRKKHKRIPKSNKSLIDTFIDLNVGDYAVHINYGIGRYLGLTRKQSSGKEKDYLTLEYAKGDKLYIPVEQMNFVQKYISSGAGSSPQLTNLGGKAWDKIKSKAKADAEATAREIIKLYAIRSKLQGTVYAPDTQWQDDFEASFSYEETQDQLRSISEIKADMESTKMMDRLVCGDVGFGKTEVAFRAVFKAVMSGKQVAILCPTTILSQQHYENAKSRFQDFPVKVDLMNRFRSSKEITGAKEKLKEGRTDVIIGTHKLLAKDISFKNLGLIVIDEEQRFGVKHKDALKSLRLETDVLTLSATPIPRTLNMALSGIRDISIIETPPLNRIPIKTFVMEFSEESVKNAIERELARNGQVFYLYNRIDTIDVFSVMVKGLCKNARIAIAHGRLSGHQLEQIMTDFINHKYDILISTTIIESGIDIPNANTILIDSAHRLGLSELYQLRGRVGRSDKEAYAYMFYPSELSLSEIAYKRLEAISEHTDLGSGFKIAMKDLEIRGAGNVLGKEQSGTIYQVGYELYTQMLEEAANEYKGEIKETTFDTIVDFKHNLFIPDTYINSPKEKISAYKIIMRAQTQEDIDSNKEYIADKYGKMPEELIDLFEVASLKTVLKRVRVLSVIEGNYNIYLKLDEYSNIDAQKVLSLIKSPRSGIYLDNNNFNQLIVPVVEDNLNWKINKIREILLQIESEPKVIKKEIELEDNIEVENKDKTSKKTKEVSMLDINLKQLSNKKTGKRRPAKTIIKKRNNF